MLARPQTFDSTPNPRWPLHLIVMSLAVLALRGHAWVLVCSLVALLALLTCR